MKKKTISSVFDTIFWGFLLVLPLIMLFVTVNQLPDFYAGYEKEITLPEPDGYEYNLNNSGDMYLLYSLTNEVYFRLGLGSLNNFHETDFNSYAHLTYNPVYRFFEGLISGASANSLFEMSLEKSNFLAFYFTWVVMIEMLHILIDLILFIPRACKKLLGRWSYE